MKYVYVAVFLFLGVVVALVVAGKNAAADIDDSRRIWGYIDGKVDNETLIQPAPDDPCAPYDPERPDFSASGKRISEQKCDEYTWENKVKLIREGKCLEEKKSSVFIYNGVVGGKPVFTWEFPHMGAIGWRRLDGDFSFQCGSSVISPRFVLTAGHCTAASELDTTLADVVPKVVRLNDYKFHFKPIKRIIVHDEYKPPIKYNDIALMEITEVKFTNFLKPACLWTKQDVGYSSATVTGWGVTSYRSSQKSPSLQAAEVDLIGEGRCEQLLRPHRNRNFQGVKASQVCAGKLAGGVDACQGDSGGPLQVTLKENGSLHHVVGVTSFGIGCAMPNSPGIYTRVSSYIDWIESVVWP